MSRRRWPASRFRPSTVSAGSLLVRADAYPCELDLRLNAVCHPDYWDDPEWRQYGRALGLPQEEGWYHRKAWEWTQCVFGLEQLGVLGPAARVLGVGAGHECVLYYLANRSRMTVATDLYSGAFTLVGAEEADPGFLHDPAKYAPFPYKQTHLSALPADGTALPFAGETFDVVYSLSSIEHFGGHQAAAAAMREIGRVLRPGGVACIATELLLAGGPHPEFFSEDELERWIVAPSEMELVEPFTLRLPPDQYVSDPVRLPEEAARTPHIVVSTGGWVFTSVMLFLRKARYGSPASGRRPAIAATAR